MAQLLTLTNQQKETEEPSIDLTVNNNYLKLILKGFSEFYQYRCTGFVVGFDCGYRTIFGHESYPYILLFALILISYFVVDLGKILLAKQLRKK